MEKRTAGMLCANVDVMLIGNAEAEIDQIVRDSREVTPGSLFVAIKGERFDGHQYIAKVWEQGASVVLADVKHKDELVKEIPEGCALLLAEDTVQAMGRIAAAYRKSLAVTAVAVTGSVGKTSCKDMIGAVLSGGRRVIKTQGNFNNHIGVPLTLFRMDKETQAVVTELGMNHAGEIDYTAGIVKPEFGVITNIGVSHIENLGSREGILQAKLELAPHLQGGPLFLNADDELLSSVKGKLPVAVEYFGFSEEAEGRILKAEPTAEGSLAVKLAYQNEIYEIMLPVLAKHMAYYAMAAIMVAVHMGLTKEEILQGFAGYEATGHRLQVIKTSDCILLDDTYNASPASMKSALETLVGLPMQGRRVAILGDMFELGSYAKNGHAQVGRMAAEASAREAEGKLSVLICCGPEAYTIYEEAQKSCDKGLLVYYFENTAQMEKKLFTILQKDDIILLKASHGMAFDLVCETIRSHFETNGGK